jgi:hypothetical protein
VSAHPRAEHRFESGLIYRMQPLVLDRVRLLSGQGSCEKSLRQLVRGKAPFIACFARSDRALEIMVYHTCLSVRGIPSPNYVEPP